MCDTTFANFLFFIKFFFLLFFLPFYLLFVFHIDKVCYNIILNTVPEVGSSP